MLSALTGLLFHLSTLFRVDAWFGALFPLPVVIAAARHGNAAARRVAVVTTLLLFVLSGPLRAANYVFLHGAMAVALGSLWNARAKWIVTVPASAAVRSAGIFASLAFSSLVLKENVMKLLVTQMFGLLDQIAANVGSTASPTVGGVWCCAVFFVLLNSLSYVAILHAVYAIVLRAVGGVDPEYVNAPDKVKQVLGVPVNGGGRGGRASRSGAGAGDERAPRRRPRHSRKGVVCESVCSYDDRREDLVVSPHPTRASHLPAPSVVVVASGMSSRGGSMTCKTALVLVVALFAPPTAGQLASDALENEPASGTRTPPLSIPHLALDDLAPSAVPGGGLHEDASMACSGCAAVAHQLRRLLERPPRRLPVTEIDPATGKETRVPFARSREFLEAALRRACEPVSLASFERGRTWLGDTTWRLDTLPFFPEDAKPVDEDLRRICLRALEPGVGLYADAFASVAARGDDPKLVCRAALGCGVFGGSLGVRGAFLETFEKAFSFVTHQPLSALKLAPVFLCAFVVPFLFRPMVAPPRAPGDQNDALRAARAARAGTEKKRAAVAEKGKTRTSGVANRTTASEDTRRRRFKG